MTRSKWLPVVAILAIAVAGLIGWSVYTTENPDLARQQLHALQTKIAAYRLDTGSLPRNFSDLLEKNNVANWNGPYVKTVAELRDPRSRDFHYEALGASSFRLSEVSGDGTVLLTETYDTQPPSH